MGSLEQRGTRRASTRTDIGVEARTGRRLVRGLVTLVATLTLAGVVMVSVGSSATSAVAGAAAQGGPAVPQSLLDAATAHLDATFRVVVQGGQGTRSASVADAVTSVRTSLPAGAGSLGRRFSAIDGVSATLTG